MAPPNGAAAKARKNTSSKQPSKPVVPALPLPYVKRQAAAKAAVAAAASAPAIDVKPVEHTEASPTPKRTNEKLNTNGGVQDKALDELQHTKHSDERQPVADHSTNGDASVNGQIAAETTSSASRPASESTDINEQLPISREVGGPVEQLSTKAATPNQPTNPPRTTETSANYNGEETKNETNLDRGEQHAAKPPKTRPPPAISPTRYQMPPPFQPANRPYGMMNHPEMTRGPRPHPPKGPGHMHQAHPSSGSIHFGTFHDSQSSSPAPPHTGGIVPPPPGMPGAEGRPPFVGHTSNGFPPMMPYGADMMQGGNFDSFGRPMGYAPVESFPPYGGNFGPSTPHSFHDSQSSGHAEDHTVYNQYPPGGLRSAGVGPSEEAHNQHQPGRPYPSHDHPGMAAGRVRSSHMISSADDGERLVRYLQQQFAAPELADCALELRYLDDRAPPVRIPGHRLILARSGPLGREMRKQALQPGTDRALQTLLLETDSKWMRSDSFYMAVQRLYGLPLLPLQPDQRDESAELSNAGSTKDQFEFALGYATAGHLLDWTPVLHRGCEVAVQLLSWQTLEAAVEFALDGYSDNGSNESYKYGDGSRTILNAVVTFIVQNLPPNFKLDISAEALRSYARLPDFPPPPKTGKPPSPTVARGSSVQLGKGRRSQQITGIQFGDLSMQDETNDQESETPKATAQAQPVLHGVLSRILLNLPFTQLKMTLESSGSGNVNGWANAESRGRIIRSTVDERESRRRRAMNAVISGRIPNAETIRAALRSPVPRDIGSWCAVGWQEEILPYGNPDGPTLVRKWVPLVELQDGSATEYP